MRKRYVLRADAWNALKVLTEHTQSESLREACAGRRGGGPRLRCNIRRRRRSMGDRGALHDFEYEQYPDLKDHPFRGAEILRERGCPDYIIRAILSHGEHTNTPRESRLEHVLFACDELAGFVTAAALVRPSKSVRDLEASSVMKRMKDKAFAKGVSRDDLRKGAEELGLPLDEHIANVIGFMRERAEALGL